MENIQFKNWLISEGDIFGFEKGREREYFHTTSGITGKAFDPINGDTVLEELSRHPLGIKNAIWSEGVKVEWGEGPGAIRIDISPWGSFKAILKRHLNDLEGSPVWITKKVIPFKEKDYNKNEMAVAHKLYEDLQKIDQEMLEMPSRDFKGIERLVRSLASKIRLKGPQLFIYQGVRQLGENNFMIHMGCRGHGVERRSARRLEQFNINVSYEKDKGTIRTWGYDISSPTRQHLWQPRPSEWELVFTPSQPREEIETAVIKALSTY